MAQIRGFVVFLVIQSTLKTNNGGQNVNGVKYPEIMRFSACSRSSHGTYLCDRCASCERMLKLRQQDVSQKRIIDVSKTPSSCFVCFVLLWCVVVVMFYIIIIISKNIFFFCVYIS